MGTSTMVLGPRGTSPWRAGMRPVAMAVVGLLLVGGTYLWQHAQVNEERAALGSARSAGSTASVQAAALREQVEILQGKLETLGRSTQDLRARSRQVSGSKQHVASRLTASEQRLARAEARMTAFLGSPVADGRYFGEVVVVGANQSPPRLVIDLARWLTGDAAQQAEIEYGIPPEARYDNFIENESPAWHTIAIAPTVAVSIIDMDSPEPLREVGTGLVGTQRISLGRFSKMMDRNRLYNPFWIDVVGGRITSIQEEYTE